MPKTGLLLLLLILALSSAHADEDYTIAIIGTGNMASALGPNLAQAGHTVVYGSRDPDRESVAELIARTGENASATTQAEAAVQADIVILAVPWFAVERLIPALGNLDGKIIIDITTGDRQGADGYPELAVETSTSEMIQEWAPAARIVKTPFAGAQTVRNQIVATRPVITYLAADDRKAKEIVAGLAIELNFFPLDAGPLRMAKTIDHLGLLYLTPLVQGRELIYGGSGVPVLNLELSCIPKDGWFEPVADAGDLAKFPNLENVSIECPDFEPAGD
ncbi:MAG: NAD(P)-binding domain-containing protein [Woeseiaceae bacterium]|nr:NAD(P)-binding domain-containing protein [Woeseiaceae bacterium]